MYDGLLLRLDRLEQLHDNALPANVSPLHITPGAT